MRSFWNIYDIDLEVRIFTSNVFWNMYRSTNNVWRSLWHKDFVYFCKALGYINDEMHYKMHK